MQSLLSAARRYSSDSQKAASVSSLSYPKHTFGSSRPGSRTDLLIESKRPSGVDNLLMDEQRRRYSEAGVNRRPSAAHILTEDTDSFIIGERVFVDGVKPGRIQFIGETKFGPGDWAGVFLDEPIGKNDGSVMSQRYFTCEPRHGVFSRLYRLTREPIEGAQEILNQCRRYGYEILDGPSDRRGSVNGGSRRGSVERGSLSPGRGSTPDSRSPRRTPEPYMRASPDSNGYRNIPIDRRTSISERRGSLGIPARKFTPGKSPLASPHNTSRNGTLGSTIKIDKDPDIERLASEARRLSMGTSSMNDKRDENSLNRRTSENRLGVNRPNGGLPKPVSPRMGGGLPRRMSEREFMETNGRRSSERITENGGRASPANSYNKPPSYSRKPSEHFDMGRRGSYCDPTHSSLAKREGSLTRRGSGAGFERNGYDSLPRRTSGVNLERRGSSARRQSEDVDPAELQRRRLSEAGLRRHSATDIVLNNNTDNLMVGLEVWVDGSKKGRIAYIGTVHFAKGELAGIHLDEPIGKNNGTVGGILYFQCEPKHGLFSRLHRLALYPLQDPNSYEE